MARRASAAAIASPASAAVSNALAAAATAADDDIVVVWLTPRNDQRRVGRDGDGLGDVLGEVLGDTDSRRSWNDLDRLFGSKQQHDIAHPSPRPCTLHLPPVCRPVASSSSSSSLSA